MLPFVNFKELSFKERIFQEKNCLGQLVPVLGGDAIVRCHTQYSVPCSTLWPAVKDTVLDSGDYALVFMNNNEMTVSFAIGVGQAFRIGPQPLKVMGPAVGCIY